MGVSHHVRATKPPTKMTQKLKQKIRALTVFGRRKYFLNRLFLSTLSVAELHSEKTVHKYWNLKGR